MKAKIISLLILLVLVSFAHAATEASFVKVTDSKTAIEYYTMKAMDKSDLVIGTDKIFYGSGTGEVVVKMYIKGKAAQVSKIGIEGTKAAISVKDFGGDKGGITPKGARSIDIAKEITVSDDLQEFTFTLTFNPNEVGLQDEFDIVLYDLLGKEIGRLDPFLSGYSYRLLGTVVNVVNGIIQVDLNVGGGSRLGDKNAHFFANTRADGFDVAFTKSDGTTSYNYKRVFWNDDVNAQFLIDIDSNLFYMYYGKPTAIDDSNASLALSTLDTFETGNDGWTEVAASADRNSLLAHSGSWSYNLHHTTPAEAQATKNFSQSDTNYLYSFWFYPTTMNQYTLKIRDAAGAGSIFDIYFGHLSSYFAMEAGDNGAEQFYSNNYAYAVNNWYEVTVMYNKSNGQFSAKLYNSSLALLDSIARTTPATDKTPGNLQMLATSGEFSIYIDDLNIPNNTISQLYYTFSDFEAAFGVSANFTSALVPSYLDPENSINSVTATFTDTSSFTNTTPSDWNWLSNSVNFSTDQNSTKAYTAVGDYNVCLEVNAIDVNAVNYSSQICKTVSVVSAPQTVSMSYDINAYAANDVNVSFTGAATGSVTTWAWTYDGNAIGTGLTINHVFTEADANAYVCVTATYSDVNKTACEIFYISKTMVKIPIWQKDMVTKQTPFILTLNSVPGQVYSGLVADTNLFLFTDSNTTAYNLFVDTNSDFYTQNYLVTFGFSILQPYIVEKVTGFQITVYTIDNQNNRKTLPYITIESYSNTITGETLFESVKSDGSGVALMHFQQSRNYVLKFYQNGIFKFSESFTPTSAPNLFVFIASGIIGFPASIGSVMIEFYHSPSNVIPAVDGNISIYQLLKPIATVMGDVNVVISQNGITYYYQLFHVNSSTDYNLAYDVNVSGLNNFYPLRVDITVYDTNGYLISTTGANFAVYSFYTTTRWNDVFEAAKSVTGIGILTLTILSLLFSAWLLRKITSFRLGEDNNGLFIIGALITGVFVFVGWIPENAWIWGVLLSIAVAIMGMRE